MECKSPLHAGHDLNRILINVKAMQQTCQNTQNREEEEEGTIN
jgi:hypothetical protein